MCASIFHHLIDSRNCISLVLLCSDKIIIFQNLVEKEFFWGAFWLIKQYLEREIDLYIFNQTLTRKHYEKDFGKQPKMLPIITHTSVFVCARMCVWCIIESNSLACAELAELSQDDDR